MLCSASGEAKDGHRRISRRSEFPIPASAFGDKPINNIRNFGSLVHLQRYYNNSDLSASFLSFHMGQKRKIGSGKAVMKAGRPALPLSAAPTIVDPALAALFNSSVRFLSLIICEIYHQVMLLTIDSSTIRRNCRHAARNKLQELGITL